jgi:dTDP-4-amino-4,6-dideoxygalactose transaminase
MNIPLSKCFVNEEVEAAALRALRSGQYILGKECEAFEAELAAQIGVKQCVLGSSWTMSVYLLHEVQGLSLGDEIIVPSLTAFPTIEPLLHWGAKPVFVDVDEYYSIDVDQVEAALTPRTVGLIPVHLYGHPADMDQLLSIAEKHNLWVLEDCAQAQGARYKGKPVGSIGDFGAFSFFPSKNLTVLGDGECIATNNAEIASRLRQLRDHGRREKYHHELLGYNVRFNEINAAIGRVMLQSLESLNCRRREIAAFYNQHLKGVVETPFERDWAYAVYHMYVIRCERRDELRTFLKARHIDTGIHYPIANHRQPAVLKLFPKTPKLPRTEHLVDRILSLPIHGQMKLETAAQVCDVIKEFCERF